MAKKKEKYVIVRATIAGVHAGILGELDKKTQTVTLKKSRRLWYWFGASLSDVAANGLGRGENKIGAECEEVMIINPDGLEILTCSEAGRKSIAEYPAWRC